jgi:peroxiredoxin
MLLVAFLCCFPAISASSPDMVTNYDTRHPAPGFNLNGLDGKKHLLKDYQGKVLVLNFCSTWCRPCRAEMPSLQKLETRLKDQGLVVLAISLGDKSGEVAAFREQMSGITFPLLLDEESQTMHEWAVLVVPTTYVIDRHGNIAMRVVGEKDWASEEIVESILLLLRE